jgi:hypothetical protein
MDYAFFSALQYIVLLQVYISYDIACQWSRNLQSRLYMFPPALTSWMDKARLTFGIPKFHLPAHGPKCQSKFSLNFVRGWARVDGEGIERVWSFLNSFAGATHEMTGDGRHDALDFQAGASNFRKIIGLGW